MSTPPCFGAGGTIPGLGVRLPRSVRSRTTDHRSGRRDFDIGLSPSELAQVRFEVSSTADHAGVFGLRLDPPDLLAEGAGLRLVELDQAREFRLQPGLQVAIV